MFHGPEGGAVRSAESGGITTATAVAGQADYLVTGDRTHLLPLGEYQGVRMVSPRAFLELL